MNNDRFVKILSFLQDGIFITSEVIANYLEVSGRTIRNDIKELNRVLEGSGAIIESIPSKGNHLIITDLKKYQQFQTNQERKSLGSFVSNKQRNYFLIDLLLKSTGWIKIDDLCDNLYISRSSLSISLRDIRKKMEYYNIKLISKPRYGVKIEGKEFDIRLCMANNIIEQIQKIDKLVYLDDKQEIMDAISLIVTSVFKEYNYRLSDVSYYNLLVHIYVAILRINEGKVACLNDKQLIEIKKRSEYFMAEDIVKKIEHTLQMIFPRDEIAYIAIHLAAKKTVSLGNENNINVVINDETNEIVSHMLQEIYNLFEIDFTNDLELRMMLALHLVPFGVRMMYDLVLYNPLLKEIKTSFPMAYNLAVATRDVLEKYYHKLVKEDEIGYFALHFNLALERKKSHYDKKNILIVCSSGRGTAQLLVYRFREKFQNYINEIVTCELNGIKEIDFKKIDYVISTVPISYPVPVPILEVKTFLGAEDMKNIQVMLSGRDNKQMNQYFSRELFLTNLDFNAKEEVLKYMVHVIKKVKQNIPDCFYEAVLRRERLAANEFGNLVAIPHPDRAMSKETFVCIGILEKPIVWEKKKVQLIFLMSMENNPDRDLFNFYQLTSKFLLNKNYINEIIQKKDFDLFLEFFNKMNSLE